MNTIEKTEKNGVTTITLNRPDQGNRLTNDMVGELAQLLRGAGREAKLIIIRGAGADFCLGRDLALFKDKAPKPQALILRNQNEVIFDCYESIRSSTAPIITVVRGRATGFGCALAAAGDITIASETSQFQLPEMKHRIFPGMAMSALSDRVALKSLMYMFYSASIIDPRAAKDIGLVSQVVPDSDLVRSVEELAATISAMPIAAVRAVKEYAHVATRPLAAFTAGYARNVHAVVNSSIEAQ